MQITKFGHSCLRVVDRDADILIDPGTFSSGFESITGLTAVLLTHQHADHVDLARLPALLQANPDAVLYADQGTAQVLAEHGIEATVVSAGQTIDVGTPVAVSGEWHAIIHADIPRIPDVGYLIGGRLFHPGDALTVPQTPVEILALPVMAPWMAVKEAVDYFRRVAPRTAIPIHEKILSTTTTTYGILQQLAPNGAQWLDLDGDSQSDTHSGETADI